MEQPNNKLGQLTNAVISEIGISATQALEIRFLYPDAPDDAIARLLRTAHRLGLDIQGRQLYLIKRTTNGVVRWNVETSIDGFRVIADRTDCYAPGRETVWNVDEHGDLISVTVYAKKLVNGTWHEISATAFDAEYNANNFMWKRMPRTMLAKCAEALCLRRGFPAQLSGIYTSDEMMQSEPNLHTGLPTEPTPPPPVREPAPPVQVPPTQQPPVQTQQTESIFPENPIAQSLMELVTAKQLGMIRAIAREIGLDDAEECKTVLNCQPDELSKKAASAFIQHLQDLQKQRDAIQSPNAPKPTTEPPTEDNEISVLIDEIDNLIVAVGDDSEEHRKSVLNGRILHKMSKENLIKFRDELRLL